MKIDLTLAYVVISSLREIGSPWRKT
jgi:hypothetical protein